MSLTKNFLIKTSGYFLILTFSYLLLVFSDFLIFSYLEYLNRSGLVAMAKINALEQQRAETEDKQQIEEAQKLGYSSLIFPALFEGAWSDLPKKYGIAPLAPQPSTNLYYCNEGYGQVRYRSDRYGFRNSDHLWDLDFLDLIIVGDSFVHGACVDQKNTISSHLEKQGASVLNLGTGGNSPIHYAAIIKTFSAVKKANNIAIIFYPNDNVPDDEKSPYREIFINNNADYFQKMVSAKYSLHLNRKLFEFYKEAESRVSDQIKEQKIAVARSFYSKKDHIKKIDEAPIFKDYHIFKGLQLTTIRSTIAGYFRKTNLPYSSKVTIDLLKERCVPSSCKPIVVYIPNSQFWRPDASAKSYKAALKKYTEDLGLNFVDATNSVGKLGLEAYSIKGPHLSPKGYEVIANIIGAEMNIKQ